MKINKYTKERLWPDCSMRKYRCFFLWMWSLACQFWAALLFWLLIDYSVVRISLSGHKRIFRTWLFINEYHKLGNILSSMLHTLLLLGQNFLAAWQTIAKAICNCLSVSVIRINGIYTILHYSAKILTFLDLNCFLLNTCKHYTLKKICFRSVLPDHLSSRSVYFLMSLL